MTLLINHTQTITHLRHYISLITYICDTPHRFVPFYYLSVTICVDVTHGGYTFIFLIISH